MIELSVCIGSSCHIKGSYNVIQTFQQMIEENNLHGQVDFKGTFCMRRALQFPAPIQRNQTSQRLLLPRA